MSAQDPAAILNGFKLARVLSQDARTKSANLLGRFGDDEQAIVLLEKTHFNPSFYRRLGASEREPSSIAKLHSLGSNDVYHWLMAWTQDSGDHADATGGEIEAHVKLTVIRPATEAHIRKYSEQEKTMIIESPSLYADVVKPWIEQQPIERIQWVYNILERKKEADTILFEKVNTSDEQKDGFIILPDLKWDRQTLSSLYLVAIVHDRSLRSLRDLTVKHVPLLRNILHEAERVAREQFGLGGGREEQQVNTARSKVRCFIHYQPTYYHLHVHILSADYTSHAGAIVGQAHLLQDVIDLLELGVDFQQRTLTYALGDQSPLLAQIQPHLKP